MLALQCLLMRVALSLIRAPCDVRSMGVWLDGHVWNKTRYAASSACSGGVNNIRI